MAEKKDHVSNINDTSKANANESEGVSGESSFWPPVFQLQSDQNNNPPAQNQKIDSSFQLSHAPIQLQEVPPQDDPNSWEGVVTAGKLNVRTGPDSSNSAIRQVSRDDILTVYESSDGWYRISATVDEEGNSEWVSSTYLRRVDQNASESDFEGELPTTDLQGNANSRAHNRWVDDGEQSGYAVEFHENIDEHVANIFGEGMTREQVLSDIERAENEGRMDEADEMRRQLFIANQYAVLATLDVENNALYSPGGGKTYCNIYAYDVVTALGGYLPRVWWSDNAIERIRNGESVQPKYDDTIFEMNANALTAWMPEHGVSYGWRRASDMSNAQEEANSGKVVIILAANVNPRRSGHVAVILAETDQFQAGEDMPLISQAGSRNVAHAPASSAWWENDSHTNGAAWIYEGSVNSPILSPEQLGGTQVGEQGESEHAPELAPGESLTARNFMQSLATLEDLARSDGYDNVQTLSAVRKLFYSSGNWDTVIEGAAATGLPPSWSQEANQQIVDGVSSSQVVIINGQSVDIGHLLTGLDAGNHHTAFSLSKFGMDIFDFRSNKEFATFVGDLGSVVERYVDERKEEEYFVSLDPTALAGHYNDLAGDQDMAGNVDSYSMNYDSSMSLTENLMAYYSGESRGDNERYTSFARSIGLGSLQSGSFSGDTPEFREGLQGEIYNFAMAYQMREGAWEGISNWGGMYHYSKVSEWVVAYFIEDLQRKVASESSGSE